MDETHDFLSDNRKGELLQDGNGREKETNLYFFQIGSVPRLKIWFDFDFDLMGGVE